MTLRVNILVRRRRFGCLEDYRVSRSRASRAPPGLQAALPQALEEGRRDTKRCHHQGLRVHPEDDDASLALAVLICVGGVVVLGVYPKPLVMAALRVAAPLF